MTADISPAEARARLEGGASFGAYGSAMEHRRYVEPMPSRFRNRRRCHCGCGGKSSHAGMANGLCLTSGCELSMRRWVRQGPVNQRGAR
jgi:hypothetical protein